MNNNKVNEIKEEILKLIEENINQETFIGATEDIKVSWYRTVCILNEKTEEEFVDMSMGECENEDEYKKIPYENVLDSMSKKHNISKDNIRFFYEGVVIDKIGNSCLKFFDGIVGYENMIEEIKTFIQSNEFDCEIDKSKFKNELYKEYAIDEKWKNNEKEYEDEEYVAIVRTEGNEKWYFNELFDFLEKNFKKDINNIYQLREKTKVIYISKSKLSEMKELDIPVKIKDDMENVIERKINCGCCNNTTYVNTTPYVYDGDQCIGRFYACPICLDLHDLKMSPDFEYRQTLNGEQTREMYDYVYDKVMKYHDYKF